ncbi:MAG: aspartyl/asparaginyl beta-hydroxylase domain-containing protein [Pirellulales bacterium]|nr:aspartyl/asparaginyl beta-hydroxylase domain-containing protein [Pirellulales bacterium]
MDYHVFKSAINGYLSRHVNGDKRPTFFEISETYPALDAVTQAYAEIASEFRQLMDRQLILPAYHEVDSGEKEISATTNHKWNVFMLELLGHKPPTNRGYCPKTCDVLAGVPNLMQAFFSILDPRKSVPLHEGPYLGYLRYHLGLHCPKTNAPYIVVNSQKYTWRDGEAVLFDDSYPHEVINNADDYRAVLIVDVLRPLPFLPRQVNKLTTTIARHTYGRAVAKKVEAFAAAYQERAGRKAA